MDKNKAFTLNIFKMDDNEEHFIYVKWTVLYGLATRRFISHHINKMYDNNRIEYYQAYKRSEFTNINLSLYSSETSEMLVKVAGIFAWSIEAKDPKLIFNLINKGFKYGWNFLKNRKKMNLHDFYDGMSKDVHADEGNFQAVMGIYVSSLMDYDIVVDIYGSNGDFRDEIEANSIAMGNIIKFAQVNYEMMTTTSHLEIAELDDDVQEFYEELLDEWKIDLKNPPSLMKLVKQTKEEQIEQMEIEEYSGKEYLEKLHIASKSAGLTGKSRLFTILQLWLEIDGLSWYDIFENYTIDKDLIEKLAYFLQKGMEKELIIEEEKEFIFSYTLVLSALNHSFQGAKLAQHKNRIEEVEYEAQKREQHLDEKWQEKEGVWKEEGGQWQQQIDQAKHELLQCKSEVKRLKKELAEQATELEKAKQSEKELEALEIFQRIQDKDESDSEIGLGEMESFLQEKSIVLIGGHSNWLSKVKNTFPHFHVWEADDMSKDLNAIDRSDAVFIYWAYLSHPMYWKVKRRLLNSDAKLFYMERNTNLEKTITHMYDSFQ